MKLGRLLNALPLVASAVGAMALIAALGMTSCSVLAPKASGNITIESIQVVSGQVIFTGQSTLPDGTCLQTQLFADGEPEAWWPSNSCVPVQDGAWRIVVPLDGEGAPSELDPAVQYMLRAWSQDNPSIKAVFWFDLAGPPTPEG
jgi:hypothetical protein